MARVSLGLMPFMVRMCLRLRLNRLRDKDTARRAQNGAKANRDQEDREQEGTMRFHRISSPLAKWGRPATSNSTNVDVSSLSYWLGGLLIPALAWTRIALCEI